MMKSKLTKHQQNVYDLIVPEINDIVSLNGQWDNIISLSGPAGTGKTFMTIHIIKSLINLGFKVRLTTPTHKSLKVAKDMLKKENINIDTSTIHSFLNLKLKPNFNNGLQELIEDMNKRNVNKCDVLIVDESSMVSAELFKYIKNAINFRKAKCVLFIGDELQLPPVDGETNPVFTLKHQYKLTEIVRQAKDSPIINLATVIRKKIENKDYIEINELINLNVTGNHPAITIFNSGKEFMLDFFDENWYNKDKILAAFTNEAVNAYNKAIRRKYWKSKNIENPNYIEVNDVLIFQEAHTENDTIIHANNDIVTVTKTEKKFNDDIQCWYWDCYDEDNKNFKVIDPISKEKFNNLLQSISDAALSSKSGLEKKKMWKYFYEIKNTFQDIKYVYASTIHKLQGSTFKNVYIDAREISSFYNVLDKEFIYRLLYVAITRASESVKILL